jgi:hypothetical protein
LTPEEKTKLLASICDKDNGRIRDRLIIAVLPGGERFLADGHHRLGLWLKHGDAHGWPKPEFQERNFESWEHAKKWIRDNQRGRLHHNRT